MYMKSMYGGARVAAHRADVDLYTALEDLGALAERRCDATLVRDVTAFARAPAELLARLAASPLLLWRYLPTPNYEVRRFIEVAASCGRPPLLLNFEADWFEPGLNAAKRHLGKIVVGEPGGSPQATVRVVDFAPARKRLRDVQCLDGTSLVAFHRALFSALHPSLGRAALDISEMRAGEAAQAHYERLFALTLCFAPLADTYSLHGAERAFTEAVVLPAYRSVEARFGLRPIIVRLIPEDTEHEPFWEWYPPEVLPLAKAASIPC